MWFSAVEPQKVRGMSRETDEEKEREGKRGSERKSQNKD